MCIAVVRIKGDGVIPGIFSFTPSTNTNWHVRDQFPRIQVCGSVSHTVTLAVSDV